MADSSDAREEEFALLSRRHVWVLGIWKIRTVLLSATWWWCVFHRVACSDKLIVSVVWERAIDGYSYTSGTLGVGVAPSTAWTIRKGLTVPLSVDSNRCEQHEYGNL